MRFKVLPAGAIVPRTPNMAVLIEDNWNDWFHWKTLYSLWITDQHGAHSRVGGVKIGQFDMPPTSSRPEIPTEFEELDSAFFSLGQDDTYYEKLNELGQDVRDEVFAGLRDVAFDLALFERAQSEDVMQSSLLRNVSARTVRQSLHHVAQGNARLTPFRFAFDISAEQKSGAPSLAPLRLEFNVRPYSTPPTNIHVLIGRNGVGKTHTLRRMTHSLLELQDSPDAFVVLDDEDDESMFANVVSVTFSAFDPFIPYDDKEKHSRKLRYSYVGLRKERRKKTDNGDFASGATRSTGKRIRNAPTKTEEELTSEFSSSLRSCVRLGKLKRWLQALELLDSDPLFRAAKVRSLVDTDADVPLEAARAERRFARLSSGHKIVLLTITRLVELVDERTLVLLDEPEAHLHPPLLAAFIRALSQLLIQRNGVAIIATHSPVILQEVPASCVLMLRRAGRVATAKRPYLETFGENVGVLTREVFGLEVTRAGFHRLIADEVGRGLDFEEIQQRFKGQLGAEALALAQVLVLQREGDT